MSDEKEVNTPSIESMVDAALAGPTAPQEPNSPESNQPNTAPGNVDNTVKTGQPNAAPANVDNKVPESVPYSRFQEINQKEKEARESLQRAQEREARYLKQLDELQRSREAQKPVATGNQFQQLAEKVCAKNGWNISQLNADQLAYVQDQVRFTLSLLEEQLPTMLDTRLKPLEERYHKMEMQEQLTSEEIGVKEIAKTEFPMFDWDKDIRPAISAYLKVLDEKDPERTIKLSYEDIFYRAIVPLYKEHTEAKSRQEVRDANKQNARPLGRGVSTPVADKVDKPAKSRDWLEKQLDNAGIR